MICYLRTCVCKQPIISLYFEFETELRFYNLRACLLYFNCCLAFVCVPLLIFVLISLLYRDMGGTVNVIYVNEISFFVKKTIQTSNACNCKEAHFIQRYS